MAVALLGCSVTGGATAWPQLVRYINATGSNLGESFGTILLTGAPTGTFVAGEALSFSGGGTATLAQAALAGPNRLIVASATGTISGTITGGTSGATATVSSVEACLTHPAANLLNNSNVAIEFLGRVFVIHGNTIYRLNEALGVSGGRCEEVYRFSVTRTAYLTDGRATGGLFILNVGGVPTLHGLYSPAASAGIRRLRSSDGVTWTEALVSLTTVYFDPTNGTGRAVIINGIVYFSMTGNGSLLAYAGTYDPVSDTYAVTGATGNDTASTSYIRQSIFGWKNRVFIFVDTNTQALLRELVGGSWTTVMTVSATSAVNSTASFVFPAADGSIYLLYPRATGFGAQRVQMETFTGTNLDLGMLPTGIRTGTAPTSTVAGEQFTNKEQNSQTENNGAAESFLYVHTTDASGANRTCYAMLEQPEYQHVDVRLATNAVLPAYTAAGIGPGKTLTASANGALTVDTVAVALGDRILVKNEAQNNGIYVVTAPGSAGTPWVLTRATDFDTAATGEVETNAWVFVTAGSATNIGTRQQLTTPGPIIVDTTVLTFASTPMFVAQGAGIPAQIRIAHSRDGGGERCFTSGGLSPSLMGAPTPINGGMRLAFRLYKKPGTPDVPNVRMRILFRLASDVSGGQVPGRWGYIGAASAGVISVGNRELTGLTADAEQGGASGTLYTMDWLPLVGGDGPAFAAVAASLSASL